MRARVVVLALAACGPGLTHHQIDDAAPDTPPDTRVDAAPDSMIDAAPDSMIDAAIDAPIDAAIDAAIDARPDAAIDAAIDARPDAAIDAAIQIDAAPDAAIDARLDAATDAGPDALQTNCTLAPLGLTAATLSGCDDPGTLDGVRTLARFGNPVNVATSPTGITYVADFDSNRIRAVDAIGNVTTLVENTIMHRPFGLALSTDCVWLYVSSDDDDLGQHGTNTGTVWRVSVATGAVTVIADDLGRPRGITVLPDGRLVLSDDVHQVLSILNPTTGTIEGLAGATDQAGHVNAGGAAARFDTPYDVVVLPDGDLAVADEGNHRIRRVSLDGLVSDLAGSGLAGAADGDVSTASFDRPRGLALGPDGALYVSDAGNRLIRRIFNGQVTTIAGSTIGYLDSDNPLTAELYGVEGIDVSRDGTMLLIADGNQGDGTLHHHVRVLDLTSIPALLVDIERAIMKPLVRAVR